ncbi:MAG: hypothetical protein J3K34DRAFT_426482 [Monoraphidium minutum]|nr:MAG: hypothetical protein J3K34DRAFT_426482 [Monoraphidium minutum]
MRRAAGEGSCLGSGGSWHAATRHTRLPLSQTACGGARRWGEDTCREARAAGRAGGTREVSARKGGGRHGRRKAKGHLRGGRRVRKAVCSQKETPVLECNRACCGRCEGGVGISRCCSLCCWRPSGSMRQRCRNPARGGRAASCWRERLAWLLCAAAATERGAQPVAWARRWRGSCARRFAASRWRS